MSAINDKLLNNLKSHKRNVMENAFNIIYKEYSYMVYYISLQIVKSSDVAKEITNEAFMNFYQKKDEILKANMIKYYLSSTANNLSLNYVKKYRNVDELTIDVADDSKKDDYQSYLDMFSDYLNEEEMELIIYHLIYDFTFKDIATKKNSTVDSISSKYKRTIDKLKKHFKENK